MTNQPIGRWLLAARLAAAPSMATALVDDGISTESVATALAEDLRQLGIPEVTLSVASDARAVESAIAAPTCTILHSFGDFVPDDWLRLDRARTRLSRREFIVLLVLTISDQVLLAKHAPNLASWLATETHRVFDADEVSTDQRGARLEALRRRYKISDKEAIQLVRTRDPKWLDSDLAEWMTLLGEVEVLRRPSNE